MTVHDSTDNSSIFSRYLFACLFIFFIKKEQKKRKSLRTDRRKKEEVKYCAQRKLKCGGMGRQEKATVSKAAGGFTSSIPVAGAKEER